jgi:hypothetical protein
VAFNPNLLYLRGDGDTLMGSDGAKVAPIERRRGMVSRFVACDLSRAALPRL